MTKPENTVRTPTAFISYAWDDKPHQEWVRRFAEQLRKDGVETHLDQWAVAPGNQIPVFMERAVRENDFVLVICTPKYKRKSDNREGGVGYEGDIMTAQVFTAGKRDKFIPVLRRGDSVASLPDWLAGSAYVDLRGETYSMTNYDELLRTLRGERIAPPPVGLPKPLGGRGLAEILTGVWHRIGGPLSLTDKWFKEIAKKVSESLRDDGMASAVDNAEEPPRHLGLPARTTQDLVGGLTFVLNTYISEESVQLVTSELYQVHVRPFVERISEITSWRDCIVEFQFAVYFKHDELMVAVAVTLAPEDDIPHMLALVAEANWRALRWVESHGVATNQLTYTIRDGHLVKHPKTGPPPAEQLKVRDW